MMNMMSNLYISLAVSLKRLADFGLAVRLVIILGMMISLASCGSFSKESSFRKGLSSMRPTFESDIYLDEKTINQNLSINKALEQKDFQGKLDSVTTGSRFSNNIWGNNCDCR